ncbi:MAG: LPS export ABC transporter periplasmic protein LptC [Pseudomonadota bacterium]
MTATPIQTASDGSQLWRPTRFTPRIGGRYDKAIRVLRTLFPCLAIAVVLATAAYPIFAAKETSFVLARNTIEASEDRLRMINPRYSGVDASGRPFEVRAASAVQPRGIADAVTLTRIGAMMTLKNNAVIEIDAETGIYSTAEETLNMTAPVLVTTSSGYRIDAKETQVDLDDHLVSSRQSVVAAGPLGVFRADGFESQIEDDTLVFIGNVTATLQPRKVRLPVRESVDDGMQAQ